MHSWAGVANYLRSQPSPACLRVLKRDVQHPTVAGMTRSLGLPVGQIADWRMPHPNCHGLHVREYLSYYTAHVDKKNPRCDLPAHLAEDTPLTSTDPCATGAGLGQLAETLLQEFAVGDGDRAAIAGRGGRTLIAQLASWFATRSSRWRRRGSRPERSTTAPARRAPAARYGVEMSTPRGSLGSV